MAEAEPQAGEIHDEARRWDDQLVADLSDAVADGDGPWLRRTLARQHPADAADLLESLADHLFDEAVRLLGPSLSAEILIELRDAEREAAVAVIPEARLGALLAELDSDDGTLILDDLSEDRRAVVLALLPAGDRLALEAGLSFDEETAGRLMQREFVAAPDYWTVGQVVDHARAHGDRLPDTFFEIYVLDAAFRLKGTVALARVFRTGREVRLSDIMVEPVVALRPDMDQEEVAFLFQKYSLPSAPVVDEAGRLTGMITIDDIVLVMASESSEDLLALSNVSQASATDTVWDTVKARAPWLGINLITAFLASLVISAFGAALDRIIALAILMPVVAALGGNAGSQALAVAVRAIAERELSGKVAVRAVWREFFTGIVNGALFAVGVAVIAYVWFRDAELSGVLAAAMFATFVWACLVGILVPLSLKRMGADPAVASSVFVLTATDVMGFLTFLGLASWLLM
jgi:magnesium transporter